MYMVGILFIAGFGFYILMDGKPQHDLHPINHHNNTNNHHHDNHPIDHHNNTNNNQEDNNEDQKQQN